MTTCMCAEQLTQVLQGRPHAAVLDFGCGSGILFFVAAQLGARHVLGVDIDPEA